MKTLRVLLPLVLLSLAGVWFAGCSTTHVQQAGIAVSLVSLDVQADDSAVLQLRLQNENVVPFAIAYTRHKVEVGGVSYGEAQGEKPVALMQNGIVTCTATLRLPDAAMAQRLRAAVAAGPVDYRLQSRLTCEVGDDRLVLVAISSGRTESR